MKEDNNELKQSIADMLEEEAREEQRQKEEKWDALMEKLGIGKSDSIVDVDDIQEEIIKIMDAYSHQPTRLKASRLGWSEDRRADSD